MIGSIRLLWICGLVLGSAVLFSPNSIQGQTASERARAQELRQREQELRQRLEYRLQSVQEERLARIEEALARAKEEMSQAEYAERIATFQAQRGQYEEALAGYREHADAARAQALEQVEKARQVMVQVRSRVRLGVSLDGSQGQEIDRQGARIQSVMDDTPAQQAGLQEGDIITHLNGQSLLSPLPDEGGKEFDEEGSLPVQRLMALAQEMDAGDDVEVRYLRDGQEQRVNFEAAEIENPSFSVFSGEPGDFEGVFRWSPAEEGVWSFNRPDDESLRFELKKLGELEGLEDLKLELRDLDMTGPNIRFRSFPEGSVRGYAFGEGDAPLVYSIMGGLNRFGLELAELNPGLAEYFSTDEGLLVLNIEEGSTLGLVPGDVILAIDGRSVEDQGDVRRILGSYEEGETLSFTLFRKGREMTVEGSIG